MNPAWFFSTLSQSTAAVVGFIIAVTTVTYSIEQQKRMEKVSEFRDILKEIGGKYTHSVDDIQAQYASFVNGESHRRVLELLEEYSEEELSSTSGAIDDLEPSEAFYFHIMVIVSTLISDFKGGPDIPDQRRVESVWVSAHRIDTELIYEEDKARAIISPALDDAEESPAKASSYELFRPVDSEVKVNDFTKIRTLGDLRVFMSSLNQDLDEAIELFNEVYTNYTSLQFRILNLSAYLVFVGVFLPMVFLITLPISFPAPMDGYAIMVSQILLLTTTLILTFGIIQLVMFSFKPQSGTGENTPGVVAQKLTQYLPLLI